MEGKQSLLERIFKFLCHSIGSYVEKAPHLKDGKYQTKKDIYYKKEVRACTQQSVLETKWGKAASQIRVVSNPNICYN